MGPAKVIAEIGCNHVGDIDTAKELIKMAARFCHADVAKFQKRNPRESLSPAEYNAPHPNPANAYGETYGAHREHLEFTIAQHLELKNYCDEWGIGYSSSVWDITSAREIAGIDPILIKIPSACNTHFEMLDLLCGSYGGEIHISLGMTTRREEESIVDFMTDKGRNGDVVLYACTSSYPVDFEDVHLPEIVRLRETYGQIVKAIGYSGHHKGIAADVAAFTLGATWIERHFTLDRTQKGTDHAASLEPDGMRRLVRDLNAVSQALAEKKEEILAIEKPQRAKLKWDRHK